MAEEVHREWFWDAGQHFNPECIGTKVLGLDTSVIPYGWTSGLTAYASEGIHSK